MTITAQVVFRTSARPPVAVEVAEPASETTIHTAWPTRSAAACCHAKRYRPRDGGAPAREGDRLSPVSGVVPSSDTAPAVTGSLPGCRELLDGFDNRRDLGINTEPGAVTGSLGLAALVYGLSSAATSPNGVSHWGDAKVIVSLAAAAVLLVAFGLIEVAQQVGAGADPGAA